jgi:mRNA interferase RelE/StbE
VGSYAVEIKPSARKELEALPDHVLSRVLHKIQSLSDNPRPAGCKKVRGTKICGVFVSVAGA